MAPSYNKSVIVLLKQSRCLLLPTDEVKNRIIRKKIIQTKNPRLKFQPGVFVEKPGLDSKSRSDYETKLFNYQTTIARIPFPFTGFVNRPN